MVDLKKIVDDLSNLTVLEAAGLSKMLKEKWGGSESRDPSTALFQDRERTRQEPLRRDEGLFEFYDTCGRSGYDEFRSVVNGWLAERPTENRKELISRMRYGGDREFGTCLAELSAQAFIRGSGHRVSVHPIVPDSTNRPDFAATDGSGTPLAYVEVTTANLPSAQEAETNRENPIYNAIDGAKLPPGTILGYRLLRAGKNSPPLRPLVAEVERWAKDNAEAAKTKEVNKNFAAGDWVIELDLYGGGTNPEPATRAIGVADMGGGMIAPHKDVRSALADKSRKYGALSKPYLIVIADAKDQLFGKEAVSSALTEAVFGDEIVQFKGGIAFITHAKNGFWHGPKGPRNRHVSGVLLLPETGLWRLREDKWQPILAVNPWAERPLPDSLRTIRRFEADDGRWVLRDGKPFADIVRLPNPWPSA